MGKYVVAKLGECKTVLFGEGDWKGGERGDMGFKGNGP